MIRVVKLLERNGREEVRTVNVRSFSDDVTYYADAHPTTAGALGREFYTRRYARTGLWDELTGLPTYRRK